jgi:hypothetical protein
MKTRNQKPRLSIQISALRNFGCDHNPNSKPQNEMIEETPTTSPEICIENNNNTPSTCPFMVLKKRGSTDSCCTFWYSREEPEHVNKIFQIYNNKLALNSHLQPNSREPKRFIGKIKRYPINTDPHSFETIDELVINRRDLLPLGRIMPTVKKYHFKTRWSHDGLPEHIQYVPNDSEILFSVKLREKCLDVSYIFCLPVFGAQDKFEYFSGREDRRIGYADVKQSSFVLKKPKVNYCDPQSPPISPRKRKQYVLATTKHEDDDDTSICRIDSNDKIQSKEHKDVDDDDEEEEEDDEEEEDEEEEDDSDDSDEDTDEDYDTDDETEEYIEYEEIVIMEEDDDDEMNLCDSIESLSVSQDSTCNLEYILDYHFTLTKCDDFFFEFGAGKR